jgi:hypothetical protein
VLVRLHDYDLIPFWRGRAEGHIFKWWEFNGGSLWRNDQIWMNNICMKIGRMGNGNVI